MIEQGRDQFGRSNKGRDIKVLVSADINGRFDAVIPKVAQLQAKNHFDFMILLGNVCHPRSSSFVNGLSKGTNSLPLNLYFIDNSEFGPVIQKLHPMGKQIVHGFNYLGRKGVVELHDLKIAFFNCYSKSQDIRIFEAELEDFIRECEGKDIDILLTNEWSKEIKAISEKESVSSAEYVSKIANKVCPRYHFAAGGQSFYRMTPYKNAKGGITHFICVAPCQEELKDKYLFAVTIKSNQFQTFSKGDDNYLQDPYFKNLGEIGGDEKVSMKQRIMNQSKRQKPRGQIVAFFESFPDWARREDISEFLERWGQISHLDSYRDKKGGYSGTVRFTQQENTRKCIEDSGKFMFHSSRIKFQARNLKQRLRVEDCWFCKVNADRSLIVWQGKYIYISLEKGPLCMYHIQIIPFNHAKCSTSLDQEEEKELELVKTRLSNHFSDQGFQIIMYERYLHLPEAVTHCVVHLLPVKNVQSLNRMFEKLNTDDDLKFREWDGKRRKSQYYLQIQVGKKSYLRQIQKRQKVQADYMRQLLCQLFETPKMVHWKACQRKHEQLEVEKKNFTKELKDSGLLVTEEEE